jgi:hypothetical protein
MAVKFGTGEVWIFSEGVIPNPAKFSRVRDLARSLRRAAGAREILPSA